MRRWFNMVAGIAVLTGCPGPDTDTDTQDTEGTDVVDECADYTREIVEALHLEAMCTYYVSCPDHGYEDVADCVQIERAKHRQTNCWDNCHARDCVEAVTNADECATVADIDNACNLYWTTCE